MPRHSPCALLSLTLCANLGYSCFFPSLIKRKDIPFSSVFGRSKEYLPFIKDFLLHFLLFGFQGASVRPCFHTDSSILCLPACLRLVGQSGLEPPTSRLSVVCSSQLSYWPGSSQTPLGLPFGGDEEVRTPDLLRARQALSHLSYTP